MSKYTRIQPVSPYTNYHLNSKGFELYEIGLNVIKSNKLAVVILAGGQGTRLGTKDPKGCFVLPRINKSLFQLHCENVREISNLLNCKISLIIMTSSFTHSKTTKFFSDNKNFGCENVLFVQQPDTICHDFDGKPLEWYDGYARAPNGNGSIFKTFSESFLYDKIRDVEYFNVISVDNALGRVCDAILVGLIAKNELDCVSKSIDKLDDESVGVFVQENDRIFVKEYSEISLTESVDANVKNYKDANICHHIFHIDFMKKMALVDLPVHKAHKKIPYTVLNKEIEPKSKNGYKDEYFIFDCFYYTTKNGVLKVPRELEFAAVKNSDEEQTDTPSKAAEALYKRSEILLALEGCEVLGSGIVVWPTKSVLGETLNVFLGRVFEEDAKL